MSRNKLAITILLAWLLSACTLEVPAATEAVVTINHGGQVATSEKLTDGQLQSLSGWLKERSSGWSPSYVSYAPATEVRVKHSDGSHTVVNIMQSKVVVYGNAGQYEQTFASNELLRLRSTIGVKQ